MYDLFTFKLPDFQFALLSSDAFDPGVVVVYPEEIELLNTRSNPKRKNEFFTHQVLRQALICTVLKGSLCLSHTAQVLFCGAAVNSHTTQ